MIAAPHGPGSTVLGRYVVFEEIAAGGMATVHLGLVRGAAGFARMVAVKRLHRQYAKDPEFVAMLVDEARVAGRIHHPNVVMMLDVASEDGELVLVMEYVHGEPLAKLLRNARRKGLRVDPRIAATILTEALHGLHAAHEARDERGMELGIVHRDVSPQNIIVGADGVSRVLDFGIAKAAGRSHVTREGDIKGKFAYMPPEQLHGEHLDRRADIYAAGVVLWETLTGERLFLGSADVPDLRRLLDADVEPPSTRVADLDPQLDAVAMKALAREPDDRYPTARAMAQALEAWGPAATASEVSAWVESLSGESLARRARLIATLENLPDPGPNPGISNEESLTLPMPIRLPMLPLPDDDEPPAIPPPRMPTETIPLMTLAIVDKLGKLGKIVEAAQVEHAEKAAKAEAAKAEQAAAARSQRRRRRALIGAALAASVGLVGVVAIRARPRAVPAIALEAAAPTESAAPTASVREVELDEAAPSEVTSAAATPPSAATRGPKAPPRGAGATRPVTSNPCSPPYFLDAQGHKHYKRECL
jgi:serine/threonine-protein kinase